MTKELTLRVTDLEKKAIAFCKEKEITFPIANYLVAFAEEVTKDLQEEIKELEKRLKQEEMRNFLSETDEDFAYAAGLTKKKVDLFERNEQLTKAKEIIRDFISVAIDYIDKEDKNYSYIVEAEQFLKDSEVEK